jgi:protein-tyrosine phosphatase
MLPEAVRMLHLLLSMGKSVYVHCTAGINRATLTVVGYLTFVKGWQLEDAKGHVKARRPQAHPYIDCWQVPAGPVPRSTPCPT